MGLPTPTRQLRAHQKTRVPAVCQAGLARVSSWSHLVEQYLVCRSKALGAHDELQAADRTHAEPQHVFGLGGPKSPAHRHPQGGTGAAGTPGPSAPAGATADAAAAAAAVAAAGLSVDAVDAVAVVSGGLAPVWRSGLQLVAELRDELLVLPTGVPGLDELLGGGLREGTVLEVAGETSSGKTQLALAVAALSAARGEALVWVDTTGSFAPQRLVAMAGLGGPGAVQQGPGPSTPEELLSHVAVHRPSNVYQLLALLDTLEVALGAAEAAATWQQQQQQQQQDGMQGLEGAGATAAGAQGHMPGGPAGAAAAPRDRRRVPHLLVVDSVSALLSTVVGSSQHTQGSALLTTVARQLKQLADRHAMAVLVTNHVTSAGGQGPTGRWGGGGGAADRGQEERGGGAGVGVGGMKPALGEQWRPQPHARLQLSIDDAGGDSGRRVATLTSSTVAGQACGLHTVFHITAAGLQ